MKDYILVTGKYSLDAKATVFKPMLLGLVDVHDPKNTVSIRDILLNRRISEVLYNMGIALKAEADTATVTTTPCVVYGINFDVREHINTSVYAIANVQTDIWSLDYVSDGTKEQIFADFKEALNGYCDNFTEEDYEYIISKLALDSNLFIYCQTDDSYASENNINTNYIIYGGRVVGDRVRNLTTITPKGFNIAVAETMANPTDDIPFSVPSFYDLVCYKKYNKKIAQEDVLNADNAAGSDDYVADNGYMDASSATSFFSNNDKGENENNDGPNYMDIYEPFDSDSAKIMFSINGFSIPKISDTSIRVAGITRFWRVHPAKNIPSEAFEVNPQGKRYVLEDLIGHANLNSLPLQSNEMRYYKDLENLLKIAISIEYNAISEEKYNTVSGEISKVVEEYCKTLAEQAFNLMWCHTGTTQPVSEKEYDSGNDSNSDDTVAIFNLHCWHGSIRSTLVDGILTYKFIPFYAEGISNKDTQSAELQTRLATELPRLYMGFDGDLEPGFKHHDGALVGYVNERSDNHRWIDALIRLLRWGERKPSMLTNEPLKDGTGKGTGKYWNLNSASISSHDGNISDREPEISSITGNSYNLSGIVYCDVKVPKGTYTSYYPNSPLVKDLGSVIDIHLPIGVLLEEKMKDCDFYKSTFEDIFTYYNKIISGEKRGQIKYENDKFVSMFGEDDRVEVNEIELSQMLESFKEKTHCISNPDTGEDMVLEFFISSNAEIIQSRNEITKKLSEITTIQAYKAECSSVNIFNSMNVFANSPFGEIILRIGKKFSESKVYPTNNISDVRAEMARIVYDYLDKFGQLRYTATIDNKYSVISILEKLKETSDNAMANASVSTGDDCFDDYYKIVGANVNGYSFVQLAVKDKKLPVIVCIGRDRANPAFVVTSTEDYEKLKSMLGTDISIVSESLSKRYLTILKSAVTCWNKCGKHLDKCSYDITQSNGSKYKMIISSNKAIQLSAKLLSQVLK